MGLDLAGGQALRGRGDDHVLDPGQPALAMLDDLRGEAAVAVARDSDLDLPTSVRTVLARLPLRWFAPSSARASACHGPGGR